MANAVIEQPSAVKDVRGRGAVGFAVEVAIEGDVSVAWLSGELDVATAPLLADGLTATTSTMWPRLVLDLSNLDFVDAAGLGAIVRTRNELRSRSGELTLRAPSPFAARTLEIAGLAGLVRQFPPNGTRRPLVHTLTGGREEQRPTTSVKNVTSSPPECLAWDLEEGDSRAWAFP